MRSRAVVCCASALPPAGTTRSRAVTGGVTAECTRLAGRCSGVRGLVFPDAGTDVRKPQLSLPSASGRCSAVPRCSSVPRCAPMPRHSSVTRFSLASTTATRLSTPLCNESVGRRGWCCGRAIMGRFQVLRSVELTPGGAVRHHQASDRTRRPRIGWSLAKDQGIDPRPKCAPSTDTVRSRRALHSGSGGCSRSRTRSRTHFVLRCSIRRASALRGSVSTTRGTRPRCRSLRSVVA